MLKRKADIQSDQGWWMGSTGTIRNSRKTSAKSCIWNRLTDYCHGLGTDTLGSSSAGPGSPAEWQAGHEPAMCPGSKVAGRLLLVPDPIEMPQGIMGMPW